MLSLQTRPSLNRSLSESSTFPAWTMNFDASDLRWETHYLESNTKSGSIPECDVCNRLKWVLEYPSGTSVHLNLGNFTAITRSSTCSSHPALIRGVRWGRSSPFKDVHVWRGSAGTGAQLIGISSYGEQVHSEYRLDLLKNRIPARLDEKPEFGDKFRIGDKNWIDTDSLRRWLDRCFKEHGHRCKTLESQLPSTTPRLFVDTVRHCLVEAQPGQSYVALSYVWGAVEQYKTLREHLDQLQQDGSLNNEDIAIPRTIRDAIGLVPLLGQRYLWVDSLCILQEDGDELWDQIHNMASIYANASVTIVAGQGENADFGLRGIRGVSEPRRLPDEVHTLRGGTQVLSHGDGWFSQLMPTKYSYRAWTFQEYLFSRRKIIFKDDSVYWECGTKSWEEEIAQVQCPKVALSMGSPLDSILFPRLTQVASPRVPNLTEYGKLVYSFNAKHLTYPEDVPYAFAGIATALSRTYVGGFVCGLPAMFLDVALLWESQEACMKPRFPAQVHDENLDVLPSWSWMGWQGRIDVGSWKSGNDYLMARIRDGQTHTVPTVVWFVRESVETDLIRVESTWCKYRTAIEEHGREDLPHGWTKHRIPLGELVQADYDVIDHPDGRPYAYRRASGRKPDWDRFDQYENYLFPIPLASSSVAGENAMVAPKLFTPLLSGCTERTHLFLGPRGPDRSVEDAETHSRHKIPGPFTVVDGEGDWAGILQSNFEPVCNIEPRGQKVELVAISRGWCFEDVEDDDDDDYEESGGGSDRSKSRRKPIQEWDYPKRPRTGEKYEWYNVLWIERRKGTAYRKSVGRVERSVWERQRRDNTFLKLA